MDNYRKTDLTPTSNHENNVSALGDSAPSFSTVIKWTTEFKRGSTNRVFLAVFVQLPRDPGSEMTEEILCCVKDYENAAIGIIDSGLFDYLRGPANDGITYHDNEKAYKRYKFRPRYMIDVSQLSTKTTILGGAISTPIGVSPFSFTRMVHPSAEIGIGKACNRNETCFIQSNGSYHSVEEVVAAVPRGMKWLQFYLYKERKITANLLKRAERLGYKAVVFTVDTPVVGRRIDDLRNNYKPTQNRLGNYEEQEVKNLMGATPGTDPVTIIARQLDESTTWADLVWVKQQTRLPVAVKGIITGYDAEEAVRHGADAILVSNHGGRQLDGVPATIDVLEEVVKTVNGRCEVYIDGGIRSGTDVLKALALGARAVFIARPAAWGLGVNGSDGVSHVLQLLNEELRIAMALCGVVSVQSVDRNIVQRYSTSHL